MADNVVTLKTKKENTEEKVTGFMTRNRSLIVCIVVIAVVAVAAACVCIGLNESAVKKGLSKVDAVEYTLTKDSASLEDEEAALRQTAALADLESLTKKKNVVGVRANMLSADITFAQKNYEASRTFWLNAAEAGKKSYTAPVCYYNAGVCSEELGDAVSAADYYGKAASAPDFLLVTHAMFSQGRVLESLSKTEEALAVYKNLAEKYPNDTWSNLAQSRVIALEISQGTN